MSSDFEHWDDARVKAEVESMDWDAMPDLLEIPESERTASNLTAPKLKTKKRLLRRNKPSNLDYPEARNDTERSIRKPVVAVIAGAIVVGALVEGVTILYDQNTQSKAAQTALERETTTAALSPGVLVTYLCPDQVREQATYFTPNSSMRREYNEAAAQEERLAIARAVCAKSHSITIPFDDVRTGLVLTSQGWQQMTNQMLAPNLIGPAPDVDRPLPDLPIPSPSA